MTSPPPPPGQAPIAVPMGFAAQIKALQEAQREQAERIANLERENNKLATFKDNMQDLFARIEALEQHNAHITARRKEAVAHFLNLRTLHQEAGSAFQMRICDIQPDDVEGIFTVWGTSITTVLNHHQRVLGQLRANGQIQTYSAPTPQTQQPIGSTPICYMYPAAYTQAGYCHAHNMPYPCRICGQ